MLSTEGDPVSVSVFNLSLAQGLAFGGIPALGKSMATLTGELHFPLTTVQLVQRQHVSFHAITR